MKPVRIPEEENYDPPPAAKIFCGFIYAPDLDLAEVLRLLEQAWGPVEFVSRRIPFEYTGYYDREMGPSLSRKFVTFEQEVDQEALPGLKWEAKRVEESYLNARGGRRVNIDPGFLLPERLMLATTKPFAHRPYLAKGIYADVTLIYRKKSYRPLEWTYPDYGTPETLGILNRLREHGFLRKRAIEKGWIE
jgi:hypothetical protein